MRIIIDQSGIRKVQDVTLLDSLDVIAPSGRCLATAFEGIGTVEDKHVWIDVDWLAGCCANPTPEWRAGFDAMIAYADRAGWTRPDGSVRAHVIFS